MVPVADADIMSVPTLASGAMSRRVKSVVIAFSSVAAIFHSLQHCSPSMCLQVRRRLPYAVCFNVVLNIVDRLWTMLSSQPAANEP
jgi:hypothetical protein